MTGRSSWLKPSSWLGMGSSCSSKKGAAPPAAPAPKQPPKPKKKLDPKDFVISHKSGEAITREQGSIDGEQFNIENCTNCDIFLLDNIATSFIDDCEGCNIFMGPIESSIMMRNCKNCNIVLSCQQFRSRDCTNCKLALFSTTEPVIETSTNMQFACFDFFYFTLREQVNKSGLKIWNNKWWMIYDFNLNQQVSNWSIMPQEEATKLLKIDRCTALSADEVLMDRVIPLTLGSRPRPSAESCFVVFLPGFDQYVEALIAMSDKQEAWTLVRTRSIRLPEDRLKQLLGWTKEKGIVAQCKGKEIAGVELCGSGIYASVQNAIQNTGLASGSKNIKLVPADEISVLAKCFFETWKDDI